MGWLSWFIGKLRSKTATLKSRSASSHISNPLDLWQFQARLNKQTPLEWLLRDGETAAQPGTDHRKFGKWARVSRFHSSLQQEDHADIHSVPQAGSHVKTTPLADARSERLSFLIAYRRIVESPDNGLNSLRIDALVAGNPDHAGILTKGQPGKKRRRKK